MIWRILAFMLLAHAAWAQQISGGAGGGSSSIVSGTTPCTGCTNGDVLSVGAGPVVQDSGVLLSSLAPKASPTFTGVSGFPAGSAAAPSVAVGNSTTGLFSVSTTGFGFSVNGTNVGDYGITNGSAWKLLGSVVVGSNVSLGTGNYVIWANGSNLTTTASGVFQYQNSGNVQSFTISTGASNLAAFNGPLAATLASATGTNAVCNTPGTSTPLTVQVWATGCAASSARFKEDLATIPDAVALDVMTRLQPLSYRYRPGQGDSGADIHFGFTAEQVREINPDLITVEADGMTPHAVKYNELWAFSAGAIRALTARIDALEAR
jgi:hypothetical protein